MQRRPGKVEPGARHGLVGDNEFAGKVLGQRFESARGVDGVADRGDRGGIATGSPSTSRDHFPGFLCRMSDGPEDQRAQLCFSSSLKLSRARAGSGWPVIGRIWADDDEQVSGSTMRRRGGGSGDWCRMSNSRNNASKTPGRGSGRPFAKGNPGRPKGARHKATAAAGR
jgi:hypothetical protein